MCGCRLISAAYTVPCLALLRFSDPRDVALVPISAAHRYNLRMLAGYRRRRMHWTKTKPVLSPSVNGVRLRPTTSPATYAWASVHQGDQDRVTGLYHVNAVDCAKYNATNRPRKILACLCCLRLRTRSIVPAFAPIEPALLVFDAKAQCA